LNVGAYEDIDSPSAWRRAAGDDHDDDTTESDSALKHAVVTPRLLPGNTYTIAPPAASSERDHRLSLLFSPWPGHYDACVNRALVSFYVAMTQADHWGVCLREMVLRAGQSHNVRAQLGSGAQLLVGSPSIRLLPADALAGRRFANIVCAAPGQWPPSVEAVFAVYSALEFFAESTLNALAALERRASLRPYEVSKDDVLPHLRRARMLRRRCGLLATVLAALPASERALQSLGAVPHRFAELVLAPLFSDTLIYVDGDDIEEGVVHAEAGGGPLSAVAVRLGEPFFARCKLLIPPPVVAPPPLRLSPPPQEWQSRWPQPPSTTYARDDVARIAPYFHHQPATTNVSHFNSNNSNSVPSWPPVQATMARPLNIVRSENFYGALGPSRGELLSVNVNRPNRFVARPVDHRNLSSVIDDASESEETADDDDDDDRRPEAFIHNPTSPNVNAGDLLLTFTSMHDWVKRVTVQPMLSFTGLGVGRVNSSSLRNLFAALQKVEKTKAVFKRCRFDPSATEVLLAFCDKVAARFVDCIYDGDMVRLQERIRRADPIKSFELAENERM
jgi:hypothetical protein